MLVPAPYQAPVEEENEGSGGAKGGFHPGGKPHTVSEETRAPSSKDKREGEPDIPSSYGKKRSAPESWEVRAPKRGKTHLLSGSGSEGVTVAQSLRKDKPPAKS